MWFASALITFLLSRFVSGESFIDPPPNDADHANVYAHWIIGQTITTSWSGEWSNVTLVLWQDGISNFQYLPDSGISRPLVRYDF
jgi:hypothetical protein